MDYEFVCTGCGCSVSMYPVRHETPRKLCLTCRCVVSVEPAERVGMWNALSHGEPFPDVLLGMEQAPID